MCLLQYGVHARHNVHVHHGGHVRHNAQHGVCLLQYGVHARHNVHVHHDGRVRHNALHALQYGVHARHNVHVHHDDRVHHNVRVHHGVLHVHPDDDVIQTHGYDSRCNQVHNYVVQKQEDDKLHLNFLDQNEFVSSEYWFYLHIYVYI